MYIHKTDRMALTTRKGADGKYLAMNATNIGDPMTYANDLNKRLTGYGAIRAHHRRRGTEATEAHRALHYAEETFARMKGHKVNHVQNGKRERHPIAYARDLFRRLRGLPVLHGDDVGRRPQTVEPARNRPGSFHRALGRVAQLLRKGVMERYLRRRRRKLAIAELQALDDRLLADIGLRRNDIARAVDGLLTNRGGAAATPIRRRLPATTDETPWRLAA